MPFGLGVFEILLVLAVVVGLPAGVIVLMVKALSSRPSSDRQIEEAGNEQRRLVSELEAERIRNEELEARLAGVEEKLAFDTRLSKKSGANRRILRTSLVYVTRARMAPIVRAPADPRPPRAEGAVDDPREPPLPRDVASDGAPRRQRRRRPPDAATDPGREDLRQLAGLR